MVSYSTILDYYWTTSHGADGAAIPTVMTHVADADGFVMVVSLSLGWEATDRLIS